MRKSGLLLMLAILVLLTGCWDRKDIETRGFVLGVAIDEYPPSPKGMEEGTSPQEATPEEENILEQMQLHTGEPVYAMTVQIPIVKNAALTAPAETGGGGGEGGGKTWEITQVGNSFLSMSREMLSRSSLNLFYEHLQVIIISEKVARKGIEKVLDFFSRDPEMRRRVRIFISEGEAKRILDVQPRIEDYSSIYLARLPTNSSQNSRMVHKTDLGEALNFIHSGHDFALPKVVATKDEIKTSGAAAFKGDRMVGWLDELELEAVKFIRNIYIGGVVVTKIPGVEDGIMLLEVNKAKCKIIPIVEGDDGENILFKVQIEVEGDYSENVNLHTHGKMDAAFIAEVEKAFASEVRRVCEKTVKKVQKDMGADVFHFDHILEIKKPRVWKRIGPKWDAVFPNVQVEVEVDVDIGLIGNVK